MDDIQLRARIRRLNETGDVPCDDIEGKVWAGRGRGEHCGICTRPIESTETEFEIDLSSGLMLRVHRGCYQLWLDECGSVAGTR